MARDVEGMRSRGTLQALRWTLFMQVRLLSISTLALLGLSFLADDFKTVDRCSGNDRERNDLQTFLRASEFFRSIEGRLPDSFAELTGHDVSKLVESRHSFLIAPPNPKDRWGNEYRWEDAEDGIRITTLGADDSPGGEGTNADHSIFIPRKGSPLRITK